MVEFRFAQSAHQDTLDHVRQSELGIRQNGGVSVLRSIGTPTDIAIESLVQCLGCLRTCGGKSMTPLVLLHDHALHKVRTIIMLGHLHHGQASRQR